MRHRNFIVFLIGLSLLLVVSGLQAKIVKYMPKKHELKYVFGGHKHVLTLSPSDILETWTEDCYDGRVKSPADLPTEVVPPGRANPQTGPFYIKGAEPGDVLAVHILSLEPARSYGISSSFPYFGALTTTHYTAMLHEPLPEKVWWYEVDKLKRTVKFKALNGNFVLDLPMRPFLGCLGVAPASNEVRSTIVPEAFGGNMDFPEVTEGNTIYLPVNVPGAMLYLGDGHLLQGAGEVIGTAVEAALSVRIRVDLIKKKPIAWPRVESDDFLMTVGSYRPLEDAFRISLKEMVAWLVEDFKFDQMDAYQLLSQVGQADIAQVVDPNYTVSTKFPKKYLPEGKAYGGLHEKLKISR